MKLAEAIVIEKPKTAKDAVFGF
jgi:hypothetical protein